jgi:uncharacterized DUF497 family protein
VSLVNYSKLDLFLHREKLTLRQQQHEYLEDSQHSDGEEREWAMGATENGAIVVVVFTMRDKQIRIISARIATKRESQGYESGI